MPRLTPIEAQEAENLYMSVMTEAAYLVLLPTEGIRAGLQTHLTPNPN